MAEIGYHGGGRRSTDSYFRERQQRRQQRENGRFATPTVEDVFSRDNLYRTWMRMRQEAGQAPGPDNVRYDDLSPQEVGQLLDAVSRRILDGKWRPSPTRPLLVPKGDGSEQRELHLAVVADRVVAKALHDGLTPLFEKVFMPSSYGFRPGRSVLQLLGDLASDMEQQDRWVVTEDDVRKAFDSVPVAVAVEAHRRLFAEPAIKQTYEQAEKSTRQETKRLMQVIKRMLRGPDQAREIGIDQGCPYSPAALNLVLHYNVDVLITQGNNPLRYRFADNLVSLSRSVPKGHQIRSRSMKAITAISMGIKASGPPANLAQGEETQLLGFSLRQENDRLTLAIPEGARESLRLKLRKAHDAPNPTTMASTCVRGWIDAYGPAFESAETEVHRLLTMAAKLGHRELPSREELLRQADAARQRWLRTYRRSRRRASNVT